MFCMTALIAATSSGWRGCIHGKGCGCYQGCHAEHQHQCEYAQQGGVQVCIPRTGSPSPGSCRGGACCCGGREATEVHGQSGCQPQQASPPRKSEALPQEASPPPPP